LRGRDRQVLRSPVCGGHLCAGGSRKEGVVARKAARPLTSLDHRLKLRGQNIYVVDTHGPPFTTSLRVASGVPERRIRPCRNEITIVGQGWAQIFVGRASSLVLDVLGYTTGDALSQRRLRRTSHFSSLAWNATRIDIGVDRGVLASPSDLSCVALASVRLPARRRAGHDTPARDTRVCCVCA
jgi:hypothetical protein